MTLDMKESNGIDKVNTLANRIDGMSEKKRLILTSTFEFEMLDSTDGTLRIFGELNQYMCIKGIATF